MWFNTRLNIIPFKWFSDREYRRNINRSLSVFYLSLSLSLSFSLFISPSLSLSLSLSRCSNCSRFIYARIFFDVTRVGYLVNLTTIRNNFRKNNVETGYILYVRVRIAMKFRGLNLVVYRDATRLLRIPWLLENANTRRPRYSSVDVILSELDNTGRPFSPRQPLQ